MCDAYFPPEKTQLRPFYTTQNASAPLPWRRSAASQPPATSTSTSAPAASRAPLASDSSREPIRTPMMYSRRVDTPFVHVSEYHVAMVSLPFRAEKGLGTEGYRNHKHNHFIRPEELEIVFFLPDALDGLPELEVRVQYSTVAMHIQYSSFLLTSRAANQSIIRSP